MDIASTLQAKKMSTSTSKRTAKLVVSVLEGLRNEDSFKSLFQIITDNASTIDFIEQPGLPRKRKAPQYSILHYVNGNQSTAQAHRPVTAVEADILRTIFRQSKSDCFRDILDEVEYLPKGQLCFLPNAVKILELLLVNPAATAKPERSFSLTRRIKIWLHSNSTATHFNSLSVLYAHMSVTDSIDLVEVANKFTPKCDSRKPIFGRF